MKAEVIIIGAGAAGLGAAREQHKASVAISLIEARDRLGGRIWTQPAGSLGVEMGIIYPPAVWSLIDAAGWKIEKVPDERWLLQDGAIRPFPEFWGIVEKMNRQIRAEKEMTCEAFLKMASGKRAALEIRALRRVAHKPEPARGGAAWNAPEPHGKSGDRLRDRAFITRKAGPEEGDRFGVERICNDGVPGIGNGPKRCGYT